MEITAELIKKLSAAKQNNADIIRSIEIRSRLAGHATGDKRILSKLLDERRPSELDETKEYRLKIAINRTKGTFAKIVTSLMKIRKSNDWIIKYDETYIKSRPVLKDNSLQDYCEYNYPLFTSVTNWMFGYLLPVSLYDPNAFVYVLPESVDIPETDFLKPVAEVITSDMVVDYDADNYIIWLSKESSYYKSGNVSYPAKVYECITNMEYIRYEQIDSKGTYVETQRYFHNAMSLPVFKVRGIVIDKCNGVLLNESRLDSIAPMLDEAYREYSDLQAEVVQHIHSTMWSYATQQCTACNGVGSVTKAKGAVICGKCKGSGKVADSPYQRIIVNAAAMGEQSQTTPPAGYIQKQTEIVKIQDERVRQHLYDALASVNMEFLAQMPLNQSGTAKEIDRDELNTFVHAIAEDIVATMDSVYWYVNEIRYSRVLSDYEKQLPKINVPERFDLLSTDYYVEEIKKASEAGVNASLLMAMQVDYAGKKFNSDDAIKKQLELIYQLDPLASMTMDDKLTASANNWVTEIDLIISANIPQFVKRAFREVENFASFTFDEKQRIIVGYANEKKEAASDVTTVASLMENPLRGTVGGLSGMIEIAKAVASGLYDLEAAVALVSDRFGISEEEARKQLGTPEIVSSETDANTISKLT